MFLVQQFMKWKEEEALSARFLSEPKSSKTKTREGVLMTYSQVVNHVLETYASEDVIVEVDTHILLPTKATNLTPLQFVHLRSTSWEGPLSRDYQPRLNTACKHSGSVMKMLHYKS